MPDEITIKPPESPPGDGWQNQPASSGRTHLVTVCAVGLGVSFFLPWAGFLGASLSGFDLQKLGDIQRLLWLIPLFCVVTIVAGLAKCGQHISARLTGMLSFVAGGYWYCEIGNDLFHLMTVGAYLSLGFGMALLVLPRKAK